VRTPFLLGAVVLSLAAGACGVAKPTSKHAAGPTITIGSSGSTPMVVVANLYAAVLTHAGARVTLKTSSRSGVDLYPDVAGELLLSLDAADTTAATQTATAVPELKLLLAASGATVLHPAPALDTEVFVVTRATANLYHLTTISSLAPVASKLVLGGSPACPPQPQCQAGLQSTYGLHFKSFTSLDDAGTITVAALRGGEVQIAKVHSSDGSILENSFVALVDDKHLLNADNVIPVIRTSVVRPKVAAALDKLSAHLTTDQLARLTMEVTVNHDTPGAVARRWLEHDGLI